MKNFAHYILLMVFFAGFNSCKKDNANTTNGNGPVIRPDTLGTGWSKMVLDSSAAYTDIFFLNNTVGYLTGSTGTYKTSDGGSSWVKTSSRNFINLFVTPNGNVFATGGTSSFIHDSVFRSSNSGNTFTSQKLDAKAADIFFVDDNNGYCFTLNSVFNTTNGGNTWNSNSGYTPAAYHNIGYCTLFFRSTALGWCVDGNHVHKMNGNITSWQSASAGIDTPSYSLNSIYAPSDNVVYVGNSIGQFFKSTNGGVNFNLVYTFTANTLSDIHFISDNIGYVTSGNKIYKTTNGGSTWTVEVALGNAVFVEIHFTDSSHGWACGNNGVILKLN